MSICVCFNVIRNYGVSFAYLHNDKQIINWYTYMHIGISFQSNLTYCIQFILIWPFASFIFAYSLSIVAGPCKLSLPLKYLEARRQKINFKTKLHSPANVTHAALEPSWWNTLSLTSLLTPHQQPMRDEDFSGSTNSSRWTDKNKKCKETKSQYEEVILRHLFNILTPLGLPLRTLHVY